MESDATLSKVLPELQLAASGTMHIIVPEYRALPAAKNGPRSGREDALLAKFQSTVAMTFSFGKRLALFQNEIVPLSDVVSGGDTLWQSCGQSC